MKQRLHYKSTEEVSDEDGNKKSGSEHNSKPQHQQHFRWNQKQFGAAHIFHFKPVKDLEGETLEHEVPGIHWADILEGGSYRWLCLAPGKSENKAEGLNHHKHWAEESKGPCRLPAGNLHGHPIGKLVSPINSWWINSQTMWRIPCLDTEWNKLQNNFQAWSYLDFTIALGGRSSQYPTIVWYL